MEISNRSIQPLELTERKYIRWDDSQVEKKPLNEDEDIKKTAELINQFQKAIYDRTRHCYTG